MSTESVTGRRTELWSSSTAPASAAGPTGPSGAPASAFAAKENGSDLAPAMAAKSELANVFPSQTKSRSPIYPPRSTMSVTLQSNAESALKVHSSGMQDVQTIFFAIRSNGFSSTPVRI